ncbi:MAG TPA: DUF4440 domain-containing protein [Sphingomicrobium sp.]|nr:DUF4440 domain-containing protein [Sphingomicrobium sp.]
MKSAALFAAIALAAPAHAADDRALKAELQAKTQALLDAVAGGNKAPWDAAADPALIYVTENNEVLTKAALLDQTTPLPPGLVGHIKVTDYQLQRHGDSAVATYIADEHLDYHGQLIHTKFRTTDSWHSTAAGWKLVASMTLAALDDPPAIALPPAKLAEYAGRYELTPDIHYTVRVDGDRLLGLRDGGKEVELKAEAADIFFVPGSPRSRKVFYRDASGRVTGFGDRREGHDIKWRRL